MQIRNEEILLDLDFSRGNWHKALVGIGGGMTALFDSQAEPPKPRVVPQPQQRLPANWKKVRGKVLAKVRAK